MTTGATTARIEIPEISVGRAVVTVRGLSPLIVHQFSEKAKKMMADKQQGKARAAREAKKPEEEFLASLYISAGKVLQVQRAIKARKQPPKGALFVPGLCFKAAMVGATRFTDAKMTEIRGALFVAQECPLRYGALSMREDVVRVGNGTADLRYRGQFDDWEADLDLQYSSGAITLEEVVNLLKIAGFSQGVCEWRPSSKSGGEFGRFDVSAVHAGAA